jgi:peroxiredoxin
MTKNSWTIFSVIGAGIFLLWMIASAVLYKPVDADHVYSPANGFYAPDFTLDQLNGEPFTLSDHFGKPILLTLWTSWCTPCKAEMPNFNRVYQEFDNNEVLVVGVNVTTQDDIGEVATFVQENDLSFPILLDSEGKVAAIYKLRGLPMTFLIDAQGVIRDVIVGGPLSASTVRGTFRELLREK